MLAWARVLVCVVIGAVPAWALSPVAEENARAGTSAWRITRPGGFGRFEAYADEASVQHGASVAIRARSSVSATLRWSLFRTGHYGGAGARLMASGGPVSVGPQPTPSAASATGRVECRWAVTFTLATDPAWASGAYLLLLTRDDGTQTYVPLVVRADERRGVALVQLSTNTWQAYNEWGGESLYLTSSGIPGGHAFQVSYDRPYLDGFGAGQYFHYENYFVQWAEARGYDLGYVTNVDLDRDRSLAQGQRLIVSVGHDEYTSRAGREALEGAIAAGVNVAFVNANSVYWQVRLEPSGAGAARRTVTSYKNEGASLDPLRSTPLWTLLWRDTRLGEPENALLGVMSAQYQFIQQPWVVVGADSWIYAGTGLSNGGTIPLVVGYESDRTWANGRSPAGLKRLAASPVAGNNGAPDVHEATVYDAPSGAFVFAAGTMGLSYGLARPGTAHAGAQRLIANVFSRAGLSNELPGAAFGADVRPPTTFDAASPVVTTIAGAPFSEGLVNGAGGAARFRRPIAAVADAAGNLYVADTGNHAIRRIANDSARTVTTLAGNGSAGSATGTGPIARFRLPQGIALGPDGALYVADTGNHRIVRVTTGGTTTLVAGGSQGRADGTGSSARFSGISSITAAPDGFLYATDARNNRIVRVTTGGTVTTVAGGSAGTSDGRGTAARFDKPTGIAAGDGALFVVDSKSRTIRRLSLDGTWSVTTFAGRARVDGFQDGLSANARFMPQWGIAAAGGAVYVADAGNSRIRSITGGSVYTYAGSGDSGARDGSAGDATFSLPTGVLLLPDRRLVVVDQGSSILRVLTVGAEPPPPPPPPPPPGDEVASFTDDFDACTSANDLGARWSVQGRWYCQTQRARGETAGGRALAAAVLPRDVSVRARVLFSSSLADASGVIARSDGTKFYGARLRRTGADLVRVDGSTTTVLGSVSFAIDPAASHRVQLVATGAGPVSLSVAIDGVTRLTATDAAPGPPSGGGVGLLSGANARTQFDDFVAAGQ